MRLRSIIFAWLAFASILAQAELPTDSVYRLDIALTAQDARTWRLPQLAGQPRLVSMFYSNCQYVCPMLVEGIKSIEAQLPVQQRDRLQVLLVSLDPARDTPQRLQRVAAERGIDTRRWTLARAEASDVRKLAAVLGIQYRQLADKEFNHSTIVTLLSADGRVLAKTQKLTGPDLKLTQALKAALD